MTPDSPDNFEGNRAVGATGINRSLAVVLVMILGASVLFWFAPQLDWWASGIFYNAESGFQLRGDPFWISVRKAGLLITRLAVVALVLVLVAKFFVPRLVAWARPSHWLFLVTTLALGPGLLVNLILKEIVGRPRPFRTDLFAGDAPYVAPWVFSDYCAKNCSFVSGEAAASFWWVALAFIVPQRWRLMTALITVIYAAIMSVNRIAFGGHFLSDVVLAWLLMLLIMIIAHHWLVVRNGATIDQRAAGLFGKKRNS